MTPTVRKRADGKGFEAGPKGPSYRYAISLDPAIPNALMNAEMVVRDCRNIIFDDGTSRIFKLARAGSFFAISFGNPGDPIPTVEVTDIECP